MFDFELGYGAEGGQDVCPKRLPLISCASQHLRKRAGNQSKWVKLKTGSTVFRQNKHTEPMSETVRQYFFFSQKRKWLGQNLLRGHKYELIFAALYIFQEKILEYSCRLSIWKFFFFFHLIVNDTLKQQTTPLEGLPVIFCLMQTGILWCIPSAAIRNDDGRHNFR